MEKIRVFNPGKGRLHVGSTGLSTEDQGLKIPGHSEAELTPAQFELVKDKVKRLSDEKRGPGRPRKLTDD